MLIHNKDDIEFVTEFPCFLGHPVLDFYVFVFSSVFFSFDQIKVSMVQF